MDPNTIFQNPQIVQSSPTPTNQNNGQTIPPAALPPSYEDLPEERNFLSRFNFKKILKLLLGLVVFVVIAFFVFNVFLNKSSDTNEKVTLIYWGLWEDKPVMQSTISEFEKNNPNIKIDYIKQDIKQYRERLVARIQNGKGPDIFRFHNSWTSMLSDYLLPLPSDTISKSDFENWFYPVAKKDLIKNGAIYGIPLEIDVLGLYVNNDLFDSAGLVPPTNWVDFVNNARSLTVKDQTGRIITSGAAMGTYANIAHAPDIVSMLFVQNGVDPYSISNSVKAASDTLTFYTSFAIGDGSTWDENQDNSIVSFAQGKLAMCFGYSWDYFAIKSLNPNLSFSIHPVPHLPNQSNTIASYWAEGVSSKSTNQKEAYLFLKFLAQKDTSQKLFSEQAKTRLFGEPYARRDLSQLLKDNEFLYPFISQADMATSSLFVDGTYDDGLNTKANVYLENAVSSVLKDTSPQSAIDTLSQGVLQLLEQYGR